ncbi:MAG: FimB/Mfa2 family fimbrial subunit [Tannerellaceae bacterium]|nr:FimB/Mfa2 family fimbrial subunit [Tannerellaceae bacterium]
MKRPGVGILVLWGVLLLVSGCIKENVDNCFRNAYLLSFIYYGDGTADIFDSKIESVRLYVFDTDGEYVTHYSVPETELADFQGTHPELQPGEYEVVCWGNVTGLSEIIGEESSLDQHFLYSRAYRLGESITDVDSLYYGRQTIRVPQQEGTDTVFFRSAHIKIEVYIEGLSTTNADVRAVGDPQGWLVVNHVYTGYNFEMEVTGETAVMNPPLNRSATGEMLEAHFHVFRFGNENDISIDVYNGDGVEVYSLNLQKFMAQHEIQVEGINEVTIPIYIRFEGIYVHVSVREWDEQPVDPIV